MKALIFSCILLLLSGQSCWSSRAKVPTVSQDPYASAILLNAETGEVLFEKNADARVYPASVLKLMVLTVILDRVEQGLVRLDDMVQVTVEAYKMGGSQVYLDPKEQFSVEDMLYALMIQSANDAAVALATHVAGSKEGFVALMNEKAAELGMTNTTFHSVHGLPPAKDQQVDITTARDFGILCLALAKRPEVFPYTSTREREFRGGAFIMRTHNHLLEQVEGCDGFKTGYFTAAGFSIAATAKRNGVRIITVVMGAKDRKVRDAKAIELLARGFSMVPAKPSAPAAASTPQRTIPPASPVATTAVEPAATTLPTPATGNAACWGKFFMGMAAGFLIFAVLYFFLIRKPGRKRRRNFY